MQREDKRFYHKEVCYKKYLDAKAATKRENEEWDKLYQYIIALHDLVVLPTGNITRLKELRAGYLIKNGEKVRQWRTGPSFELMYEAYQLAEESIRWCIANKLDGSNDTKAINYGISIMIDKLNEANQIRKSKKNQERAQKQVAAQESKKDQSFKNNYNKKSDDLDISAFL
ncbi:hypothetical protein [Paenibacillus sp. XY044]|uniref:hypothetical protein n=1 Tax=Paenibacillus sp. XY044 TaxID=2026089 RepID=UPI000B98D995|nr:hypothetical protein [Paenibacillus sp. XY044]OZB98130.1 hypothetical protein CJP46_02880 [Paenibacillus sp. XY044]